MEFWTYTLSSGSLQINRVDGAQFVSVQTDSTAGQATVLGGISFKDLPANAVTLTAGQGVNFSASSPASPLNGITITWVGGSVDIIVGF